MLSCVPEVEASLPVFLWDEGKGCVELRGSEGIEGKEAGKLGGRRWEVVGGTETSCVRHALFTTGARGEQGERINTSAGCARGDTAVRELIVRDTVVGKGRKALGDFSMGGETNGGKRRGVGGEEEGRRRSVEKGEAGHGRLVVKVSRRG